MAIEPLIHTLKIPPFEVNTYLVVCPETGQAAVIDPAGQPERILALANAVGARVVLILDTHGHADHVQANAVLKAACGAPVCMHVDDDSFFGDPQIREEIERELGLPSAPPADRLLADGEVLTLGKLKIEVLHTPGHTPGSVCFRIGGNLFTGDTLFVGDVGRTDLVGGSLNRLIDSLARKIIQLPPETVVWPGHDYGETPTSTIGRERVENPYITDFILDG
jgi:hydroxyacylglutathione hydrolase